MRGYAVDVDFRESLANSAEGNDLRGIEIAEKEIRHWCVAIRLSEESDECTATGLNG